MPKDRPPKERGHAQSRAARSPRAGQHINLAPSYEQVQRLEAIMVWQRQSESMDFVIEHGLCRGQK